ncbi:unnamed protein product [Prorocentrum cordatum]|uniref:Ribosome biogenesis protein NOP53 n=1 Tax=Prorocentrum cordatum TaxID=2364126 RepID=A0ABN9SRG2_9DINO|nr:unnamed protein product [Polarella glacialis]
MASRSTAELGLGYGPLPKRRPSQPKRIHPPMHSAEQIAGRKKIEVRKRNQAVKEKEFLRGASSPPMGLTPPRRTRRQDGLWIANPFVEAEREVIQESAQQDAKWKTEKDLMRKAVSDLKVSQTEKGHVREGASDVKGKTKQVVKEKTEKDRKAVSDQKVSKDRKRKAVSPSPSSESSNAWDILRWKRKNRWSRTSLPQSLEQPEGALTLEGGP